jgi:hypothetical protein
VDDTSEGNDAVDRGGGGGIHCGLTTASVETRMGRP